MWAFGKIGPGTHKKRSKQRSICMTTYLSSDHMSEEREKTASQSSFSKMVAKLLNFTSNETHSWWETAVWQHSNPKQLEMSLHNTINYSLHLKSEKDTLWLNCQGHYLFFIVIDILNHHRLYHIPHYLHIFFRYGAEISAIKQSITLVNGCHWSKWLGQFYDVMKIATSLMELLKPCVFRLLKK